MYSFDANAIYDIDGRAELIKVFKQRFGFGVCVTDYSSIRKWYDEVVNLATGILKQEIQLLQRNKQSSVVQDLNGMISLKENLEKELKSRYPTPLDEDLIHYTRNGYTSLVQNALNKGAFVDTREDRFGGPTPLMIAAANNDYDLVKLLIKNGSNVNIQNSFGNNSLMYMVENRRPSNFNSFNPKYNIMFDIGKFLIDNGVDKDIVNDHKLDAFNLAWMNGYSDFALEVVKEYNPYSFKPGHIFTPLTSDLPIISL